MRALLVQPNLPADERWAPAAQRTNLQEMVNLTLVGLNREHRPIHVVVWPETVISTPEGQDKLLDEDIERELKRIGRPLIMGRVGAATSPHAYQNRAVLLDPEGRYVGYSAKRILVPIAESPIAWPWRNQDGPSVRHAEAAEEEGPLQLGPSSLSVVFCYEALFPASVTARKTEGTIAIVNLVNDSWFAGENVSRQQLAYSRFRAIETRLPLLRVAHGGISAVVDPWGRVTQALGSGMTGTLVVELPNRTSPRVAIEGLILFGCAAVGACTVSALFSLFWRFTQ
ncbi:MAG: apolipoprotein N-acyltransferase [bacterium]|nr:apolipoprotein N-acyltransferase [bacterium]